MFTKALHAIAKIAYLFCRKFDKLKMLQPILVGLALEVEDQPQGVLDWVELTPDQCALLQHHGARVSIVESGVFIFAKAGISQDLGKIKTLAFHLSRSVGASSEVFTLTIKSPSLRLTYEVRGAVTHLVRVE